MREGERLSPRSHSVVHSGRETIEGLGQFTQIFEDVAQGVRDKVPILEKFLSKRKLKFGEAAFVGDDVVDLSVMNRVGFAVAVADASEYLFDVAHYVTLAPGGRGAVREVAERRRSN